MASPRIDTVVIGSGISGLTVAALLAKDGRQVVIVERNSRPGGALRRFRRDGIPFDIGFHYTGGLAEGQVLRVLWEHLGIWPDIAAVPLCPEGYDLYSFAGSDTRVRGYYSYDQLAGELHEAFPSEGGGIDAYLDRIRDICRQVPFYNLELELTPFMREFATSARNTLARELEALTGDRELQAVLAAPVFLYGVDPHDTDLNMHAMVAHGYYSGAFGVSGGGQAIVDAFRSGLENLGVETLTSTPVERIRISDGRVAGIETGGREIDADQVVYTGHPHYLPDLVSPGAFRPAFTSRLRDLRDTASMFTVFGRMNDPGGLPGLEWSNLYSLRPGLDLLRHREPAGRNDSLLVTAPGRRDGETGKGAEGVIMMRPAYWEEVSGFNGGGRGRKPGYSEWKEAETARIISQAAEAFGEEYSRVTPLASGSPLTFRDELGSPAGGAYGVQHSVDQFVARARTKVTGLYLSGQGSLMTGLFGSSMAALVTAGEIIGMEKVWNRIRNCH